MKRTCGSTYTLLDSCRGVAILWIVYFHILSNTNGIDLSGHYGSLAAFIIRSGYLGNQIFFVISGYCIGASLERSVDFHVASYAWLWNRLKRIYVTYWWALVFICIVMPVVAAFFVSNNSSFHFIHMSLLEWIRYVTLFQIFSANDWRKLYEPFEKVSGHLWYIAVIVQFYVVAAISLAFRRRYWVVLTVLYLLSLAAGQPSVKAMLPCGLFLPAFSQFYVGLAVYWILKSSNVREEVSNNVYSTAVVSAIIVAIGILLYNRGVVDCFAFGFGVLIWIMRPYGTIIGNWFIIKQLRTIGHSSYSLYLLHGGLSALCLLILARLLPSARIEILVPLINIPLVVFISHIWSFGFERRDIPRALIRKLRQHILLRGAHLGS